jgi:hypothetical protein
VKYPPINSLPQCGALKVIGGGSVQHPERGFIVGLVAEDGGGHDEQRRVSGVDVAGTGNELLLQLGRDLLAVANVLQVVGQGLQNNLRMALSQFFS